MPEIIVSLRTRSQTHSNNLKLINLQHFIYYLLYWDIFCKITNIQNYHKIVTSYFVQGIYRGVRAKKV